MTDTETMTPASSLPATPASPNVDDIGFWCTSCSICSAPRRETARIGKGFGVLGVGVGVLNMATGVNGMLDGDVSSDDRWALADGVAGTITSIGSFAPPPAGQVFAGVGAAYTAGRWGRIAKVNEEGGDVIKAMIGSIGANPRKGATHTRADIVDELLIDDVAALGASQYPGGFQSLGPCPMLPHVNSPKRPSIRAHVCLAAGRPVRQTPEQVCESQS